MLHLSGAHIPTPFTLLSISPPPSLSRAWLWATLTVSDAELLASAGLDALVMVKMQTIGIQILLPMALVGGIILIPLNAVGDAVSSASGQGQAGTLNPSKFMMLTTTNVNQRSAALWVHFFCVLLFVGWAQWVLKWHYHQFVLIRQHYLRKGEAAGLLGGGALGGA